MPTELKLTPFQQRVAEIAEPINLAMLGGRAGGKSTAMALLALRQAEQYQERAHGLYPALVPRTSRF